MCYEVSYLYIELLTQLSRLINIRFLNKFNFLKPLSLDWLILLSNFFFKHVYVFISIPNQGLIPASHETAFPNNKKNFLKVVDYLIEIHSWWEIKYLSTFLFI